MPAPELDPDQRRAALDKAASARRTRADLKARLKAGEASLVEALSSDDEAVRNLKVSELLAALPRVGPITAAAWMQRLGIAPSRRVRGLGPRQRERLLDAFPEHS
ncbi:MAG: integration host factor, actinobacterial type [Nitriliruptoraceae bacterium]